MKNMKVSTKLTASFIIIIALTIIVGIAGIIGMMLINSGNREMYESQSQPLADLGMAREYFQRLRVQLRDVVFASGNIGALDLIEADLDNYERGFITYMGAYKPTIVDPDIIELYEEIMEAFSEYQPNKRQIVASARVSAPSVQMLIMMNDLVEPTDFIMDALHYLAYVRVLQAGYVNSVNSAWFHALFILIVGVITVSIAIALLLAKHISSLINKQLAVIGSFANKLSTGEISMASVSEHSIDVYSGDEFGALARILEQSYARLNEYEQSKRELRRLVADNAAIESLSRMKTEYLANMSHEIKTPLTVISGHVQRAARLFEELSSGDKKIRHSLNKAQEEIMRVARLIESALKMAAMQESHENMKPLNAASLFTINAEAYRSIIEKRGNVLNVHAAENLPLVFGHADRLIQVLTNLLTNANKHTENGEISVNMELKRQDGKQDDQFVAVIVKDNGTEIAPELLPYVFERGITDGSGTGIGLTICKNIIESHSGTIEIESPAADSGKGTAVTFSIPVYKDDV
jgi:signal transduction histidine kinase